MDDVQWDDNDLPDDEIRQMWEEAAPVEDVVVAPVASRWKQVSSSVVATVHLTWSSRWLHDSYTTPPAGPSSPPTAPDQTLTDEERGILYQRVLSE